jgi:hypothetical protein
LFEVCDGVVRVTKPKQDKLFANTGEEDEILALDGQAVADWINDKPGFEAQFFPKPAAPGDFCRLFYEAYPESRRIALVELRKVWASIPFVASHGADVLSGLFAWKQCEEWQKEKFVPKADKFLKQHTWENPPPKPQGGSHGKRKRDFTETDKALETLRRGAGGMA